ncbi:very short patch repair endonuclease [Xanthomonas sacchari]|uniref:very short patch repair endonuclease n=1 Tax=Xanthomonas sacchari TaxID=56458 RepID=UPI003B214911
MQKDPSAVRSANMARIKGADTKPELVLRHLLWSKGYRYRLKLRIEGVRPDFCFPKQKLLVFIDGCFWHGCTQHYVRPRSRGAFWAEKLASNISRDRRQTSILLLAGWRVLRLWEHEIDSNPVAAVDRVVQSLNELEWRHGQRPVVVSVVEAPNDPTRELWSIEDLFDPSLRHEEWRTRRPARSLFVPDKLSCDHE